MAVVVVGAGPSGLIVTNELLKKFPELDLKLLEASDRVDGDISSGLHLVPDGEELSVAVESKTKLNRAVIRWERQWLSPESVDWSDKEWVAVSKDATQPQLPQWRSYLEAAATPLLKMKDFSVESTPPQYHSPVSRIEANDEGGWQIEAAGVTYDCRVVIWAAGLQAFQNAYGKFESQDFLTVNPRFQGDAQDFRGGISLEMKIDGACAFEEGFPRGSIFGLPVKHNGKRFLLIGAVDEKEDCWELSTLTHLDQDLLNDPKELLSLQKSLKRGLKAVLPNLTDGNEKWIVNTRVGGHTLGSPWALKSFADKHLYFAGDECEEAAQFSGLESRGAILSAFKLSELLQQAEPLAEFPRSQRKDLAEESTRVRTRKAKVNDLSQSESLESV